MNKLKTMRITASVVTSIGLMGGFAGVAGASPHHHHDNGPVTKTTVKNKTDVDLTNNNPQSATTGDATVSGGHHHHGGSDATAQSGNATNDSSVEASVSVSNTAPAVTPASGEGAKTTTTVKNKTNVDVTNNVVQSATSGDAKVTGNSHGGSATSGDASNTSSASFTVNVTSN